MGHHVDISLVHKGDFLSWPTFEMYVLPVTSCYWQGIEILVGRTDSVEIVDQAFII